MAARTLSDQQYEAVRRRRVQEFVAKRKAEQPELANMDAVDLLNAARTIRWRHVTLHVPPIPYRLGLRCQALLARYDRGRELTGAAAAAEMESICDEAARLLPQIFKRRGIDRLFRSPFKRATEAELVSLLVFACAYRMSAGNRYAIQAIPRGR